MRWKRLFGSLFFGISFLLFSFDSAPEKVPKGVFRPWDGEWQGDFIIYSAEGEKKTIRARHVYRSRDDFHQEGEISDTLPDGTTHRKTVVNTVEGERLFCRIYREDGSLEVEHQGVYIDGYIFWSNNDREGRLRQFYRERVAGDTYTIDGFGIYGPRREVVEIYAGRYRRAHQTGGRFPLSVSPTYPRPR